MVDYQDLPDNQIKHLEMIQAVVARLGNNAFLIKGWAITIAGAFLAFAVNREKYGLALAALAPTILFWILDASFLRNERLFRHLFDRVRQGLEPPFVMGATAPVYVERVKKEAEEDEKKENIGSRWRTFWRETLVLFYGAIILTCLIAAALLCHSKHS
jgi:predicted nuclease of restriction endonuclease-like RecB superfamily